MSIWFAKLRICIYIYYINISFMWYSLFLYETPVTHHPEQHRIFALSKLQHISRPTVTARMTAVTRSHIVFLLQVTTAPKAQCNLAFPSGNSWISFGKVVVENRKPLLYFRNVVVHSLPFWGQGLIAESPTRKGMIALTKTNKSQQINSRQTRSSTPNNMLINSCF